MKRPHVALGLLALLSVITYLDRVCISVAGPTMQHDLGLGPEQWGWVLGIFLVSYGLFAMPCGALGDRIGPRKMLAGVVLWWSAFTSLTGAAFGFTTLTVTQFFFGAGEAGAYPNITGGIGRSLPASEQARAQGIVWGASRVGGALSPLLVVPLLAWIGWRRTFFACSVLGVAWTIVWLAWYREPRPAPGEARPVIPWRRLLRSRQIWLIVAMYWCYAWGSIFFLTWFPTYLVKGRGFSEKEMGVLAAAPYVMGLIGNIAGGITSDRLVRRIGLSLGRRLIGTGCLIAAALCLVATSLTAGKALGIVLLAAGFGVMDFMLPSAWSLCMDVGGPFAGTVSGAMNTAGSAGGFVCAVSFGYLVRYFGNYDRPLLVVAALVAAAAVIFWQIDPTQAIFDPCKPESSSPPTSPYPASASAP
ncbi:MAG: MFS transporter [Opitutaceae bacterium]